MDDLLPEKILQVDVAMLDIEEPDPALDAMFEDAQEVHEPTETEKELDRAVAEAKAHQECAEASAADMQAQIGRLQIMLQEQQTKEAQEVIERTKKEEAAAAAATAAAAAGAAAAAEQAAVSKAAADHAAALAFKLAQTTESFEMISFLADPDTLTDINIEHLKENNPAVLEATADLYFTFNRWRQMGAAIPFSFGDLIGNSKAAADTPKLIQDLLGGQWKLWFKTNAATDTILPRQAVLTILASLEKAKDKYENAEKAKEEAKQCFDRIVEASKKRRLV